MKIDKIKQLIKDGHTLSELAFSTDTSEERIILRIIAEVESLQKELEIKTQYLNQKDDEIRLLQKENHDLLESHERLLDKWKGYPENLENLRAVLRAGGKIIKHCELSAAPIKLDYALKELIKAKERVSLDADLILDLYQAIAKVKE